MRRRRGFVSAVKNVLRCESKANREKVESPKSGRWFGKRTRVGVESSFTENVVVALTSNSSSMEDTKLIEAENEQINGGATTSDRNSGKTKEDVACLKIQTAFRGYVARRKLTALKGLVMLKSLRAKFVARKAATTLKGMQMLVRVQSEVCARRRRILTAQQQKQHKPDEAILSEKIGRNWDNSMLCKEQIEANIQNRKYAAIKRERALVYAYAHQQTWRNSSSGEKPFIDSNNPNSSWSWLEQWMASENGISVDGLTDDHTSLKSGTSRAISDKKIATPTARKRAIARARPRSSRGAICTEDNVKRSTSSVQSDQCQRRSIAGSSARDDESFAGSCILPGYMMQTEAARAKARLPSPLKLAGTASACSSGRRLSFSCSPTRPRSLSGAAHVKDTSPNL